MQIDNPKRGLMYVTHGHVFNLDNLPPIQPGDLLLHGHTHVPSWRPFGQQNVYLNPGSVSIPKEGSLRGYMTLEGTLFRWCDLAGTEYHRAALEDLAPWP